MLSRSPSAVAAAGLLLLALVGCSGSGSDTSGAASTSPTPAATSTPSPASSPSAAASTLPSALAGGAYVDPDGFSITYPKDWKVRPDVAGLQVIGTPAKQAAPDFADNVGVLLENTQMKGLTAEQYVKASVQNAPKQVPDFTVITMDAKAGTLEYTGTVQRPLHFLARVVVKDGKAFTATFTATAATFAGDRPAAEKVLTSLKAT